MGGWGVAGISTGLCNGGAGPAQGLGVVVVVSGLVVVTTREPTRNKYYLHEIRGSELGYGPDLIVVGTVVARGGGAVVIICEGHEVGAGASV